jgi:hypothetical protein
MVVTQEGREFEFCQDFLMAARERKARTRPCLPGSAQATLTWHDGSTGRLKRATSVRRYTTARPCTESTCASRPFPIHAHGLLVRQPNSGQLCGAKGTSDSNDYQLQGIADGHRKWLIPSKLAARQPYHRCTSPLSSLAWPPPENPPCDQQLQRGKSRTSPSLLRGRPPQKRFTKD